MKTGRTPWNKGKTYSSKHKGRKLSEEHKQALRVPRKGAGVYERTEFHKEIVRNIMKKRYENGEIIGFRKKPSVRKGEQNNNWKGGVTSLNEKIRKSKRYKDWRKAVFERDGYTCNKCGKIGGDLHADHIKQFAFHPELRFELSNGRTLCKKCHRKTKTYGANHACCTNNI